jgi:hypothetical protein
MVNDRQLSTSLKNKANKLFISCSLCYFLYRPFSLPKSVLSYDTYQSPSVRSDGNKRIAATLFLWFLNNNGILYRPDGSKRIANNTLVALTLMIAESKTEEKDVMVKVVVNLINQRNE